MYSSNWHLDKGQKQKTWQPNPRPLYQSFPSQLSQATMRMNQFSLPEVLQDRFVFTSCSSVSALFPLSFLKLINDGKLFSIILSLNCLIFTLLYLVILLFLLLFLCFKLGSTSLAHFKFVNSLYTHNPNSPWSDTAGFPFAVWPIPKYQANLSYWRCPMFSNRFFLFFSCHSPSHRCSVL